jgi:hypothetical protein
LAAVTPISTGCHRRLAASVFVAIARDYIDNAVIDSSLRVVHAMARTAPLSV